VLGALRNRVCSVPMPPDAISRCSSDACFSRREMNDKRGPDHDDYDPNSDDTEVTDTAAFD
jgi:hypothetical protein